MGRPRRIEYPGAFDHVTSRGNERRDIVKSRRDREKCVGLAPCLASLSRLTADNSAKTATRLRPRAARQPANTRGAP